MSYERVVLIVDEQEEMLQEIEKPLNLSGSYRVLKAKNQSDAFDIILDDFVDVLISDLSLTADNGLALLDKVSELPVTDRPIVYVMCPDNTLTDAELKKYSIHKVIKTPCKFNLLLEELGHTVQKLAA